MMKTIKLFGDLQSFKADWQLNVQTPSEALRAIEANRPGFLKAADQGEYVLLLFDAQNPELTRQVLTDNALDAWADEELWIVPRVGGEFGAEIALWIGGALATTTAAGAATLTTAGLIVAGIINLGISLAISAIANLITGSKKSVSARDQERYESKPSFISNGPVNVARAGHPYPIIVGRVRDAGSIRLSINYYVEDIPV